MTSHDAVDVVRRALGTRKVGHAGHARPHGDRACSSWAWAGRRGCCGSSATSRRPTRARRASASRPRRSTPTARSTGRAPGDGSTRGRRPRAMSALARGFPPGAAGVLGGEGRRPQAVRGGAQAARSSEARGPPDPRRRVRADLRCADPTSISGSRAPAGRTSACSWPTSAPRSAAARTSRAFAARRSGRSQCDRRGRAVDRSRRRCPSSGRSAHLPRLELSSEEAVAAGHGRVLGPAGIQGPYAVFAPDGALVGVYEDEGPKARPQVILAPRGVRRGALRTALSAIGSTDGGGEGALGPAACGATCRSPSRS